MEILSQIGSDAAIALATALCVGSFIGIVFVSWKLLAELRRISDARRERQWKELLRDWREIKQDPKDTLR
jgi:hypothetical protein